MKDLYIVGVGGFGREVADVVDAVNAVAPTWNLVGFVDDDPSDLDRERAETLGVPVVGGIDDLLALKPAWAVIGIGSGSARRVIDGRLTAAGWRAPVLVHPSVTTGAAVTLKPGTILCAGVRLTTNISLGRHVHVNLGSTIGHDSTLDDYVSVNPLVAISGNVTVGAAAMVGTHAAILQDLTIGAGAVVGGSALVVKDVPESIIVKGVPAR